MSREEELEEELDSEDEHPERSTDEAAGGGSPTSEAAGDEASPSDETGQASDVQSAVDESKEQLDAAAESFVEVEQELGHLDARRTRGEAIDVDQVPASEVPDDFPYEITTDDALALRVVLVDSGEQTVTTYFEWPEQEPDTRLAKLLDLHEIAPSRFADLHGTNMLLRVEGRHYVPVLPKEEPRGDERAIYGVFAGIAPSFLIALAGIFGAGGLVGSGSFFLLWLLATFVVLPISVYLDAWDLRSTTDWDGGPLFWATLALVPGVNVLSVPLYLIGRANAEPLV